MASKRNAACAALAALAFALPASATVLYSTDFASPTFTTGALAGQGGWGVFTFRNGNVDGVTVQTTLTDQGEPAVDFGTTPATAYYLYGPVTPKGPIVVSMDIYEATPIGSALTAIFNVAAVSSVETFDSSDQLDDRAAGVEIDKGFVEALPEGSGHLAQITGNTWYNLSLTLDYTTQTYDIALGGQVLASNVPFCGYEPDSNSCTGAQSSQFEGIAFSSQDVRDGAMYFGDVSISEVPEPATWTMMFAGLALTGLALRRRRPLRRPRATAEPSCQFGG